MQRSSDRSGRRTQLAGHDLDTAHVGQVHATDELLANWIENQIAGRCDPAAYHHAVHAEQHDDIADADAKVAARVADPAQSTLIARSRSPDRLLDSWPATGGRDGIRLGERLDATVIPAAAERAVGKDRLVAELARRSVVAHVELAAEDEPSPHSGSERDPQHRGRAAPGAKCMLGEGKGARVIDHAGRDTHGRAQLGHHRKAVPSAWNVGDEACHALVRVEDAGNADADRRDGAVFTDDPGGDTNHLPEHSPLTVARIGTHPSGLHHASAIPPLDHRPLHVRPADVDAQVPRHVAPIVPLMGQVMTVLGPIDAGELGVTDAHDHLFLNSPALPGQDFNDVDRAVEEVTAAGLRTIVEVTPIGLGRDPAGMRAVSERTGVHIVAATGFHRDAHYPTGHWVYGASLEQLAGRIVTDLQRGMDSDSACAGVIKAGASYQRISDAERQRLRAAAIGCRETGAPILVHTEIGTCGHEIVDLLARENVRPDRIILAHLDRNPDFELHGEIAARGVWLEYDTPGRIKYRPDSQLIDLIDAMIRAGHGASLMLGLDLGQRDYFRAYGGGPGLAYLMNRFAPRLQRRIGEEALTNILVGNPARAFTVAK